MSFSSFSLILLSLVSVDYLTFRKKSSLKFDAIKGMTGLRIFKMPFNIFKGIL